MRFLPCPTCREPMTEVPDRTWRCRYCGSVEIVKEVYRG